MALADVTRAVEVARSALGGTAQIGIVLGSGLGAFADQLAARRELAYADIPGFPVPTVHGHGGRLVSGASGGVPVVVMSGRLHVYEGYSPADVVFPIRVLRRLGARVLICTNASGCLRSDWAPGELMRIVDHLNLSGRNPLAGPNDDSIGPRFPDMTHAYDPRLGQALSDAATAIGLTLRSGVYAHVLGPSYETPAEIRMLRVLGADAVGMSTVPEVIAGVHAGMAVAGIACLTNLAAGIRGAPLSHAEVTASAERASARFIELLNAFIPRAAALAP